MQALKVTPSSAKADLTMSASRMSWKGRTFDSRRDLTFSEIQRRVVWDTVGLLAGTRLGSCNHQFLSQGGRHLSIPSCRVDLRKSLLVTDFGEGVICPDDLGGGSAILASLAIIISGGHPQGGRHASRRAPVQAGAGAEDDLHPLLATAI